MSDYIVINDDLRTMQIPSSIVLLGVESDDDVNKIQFQMPKTYCGFDLSAFSVRVNYMNANGDGDIYIADDVTVDGDNMTFTWLVGRNACKYKGNTKFIVCLKLFETDSDIVIKEFNTTVYSLPVLEGLETTEAVEQQNADIIEYLINLIEQSGGTDLSNYYTKQEVDDLIPTKLPNPEKLTINGNQYDGSAPVDITIEASSEVLKEVSGKVIHINDAVADEAVHSLKLYDSSSVQLASGEIAIANKNLFRIDELAAQVVSKGITFTKNADGSITCNGTSTGTYPMTSCSLDKNMFEIGRTYCLSSGKTSGFTYVQLIINYTDNTTDYIVARNSARAFTINKEVSSCTASVQLTDSGVTVSNETVYPMLEIGSTASAFVNNTYFETTFDGTVMPVLPAAICNVWANDDVVANIVMEYEADTVLGKVDDYAAENILPVSAEDDTIAASHDGARTVALFKINAKDASQVVTEAEKAVKDQNDNVIDLTYETKDDATFKAKWLELDVVFDTYIGKYITPSKYWTNLEGFSVSDPISVMEGMKLRYEHNTKNPYIACIAFSDGTISGGNYVINSVIAETTTGSAEPIETTVPNGAKYVFISKQDSYETETSLHLYYGNISTPDLLVVLNEKEIPDGSIAEQKLAANSVSSAKLQNESVSIKKTDFVEAVLGNNLFDENTMVVLDKYYYTGYPVAVGKTVTLQENQYTTNYGAVLIPLSGQSKITLSVSQGTLLTYLWYFTGNDDKVITFDEAQFSIDTQGTTLTVPSGATKFYVNFPTYKTKSVAVKVMVSDGETAKPWEKYTEYLTFNGVRYREYTEDTLKIKITAPDRYELVIGDTFELFYKGIINAIHPENLYVEILCAKGKAYKKKYVYTPVSGETGTYAMTIRVYDNAYNMIDEKSVNLVVKAKATNPVSEKVVLYVGDSLANSGDVPHEFDRRLTSSSGTPSGDGLSNISFIGTCEKYGTKFEGYGGYTFNAYNTQHKVNSFMWITCANHGKTEADQHSLYKDSNNKYWKLETIENDRIKIICTDITGSLPSTSGTLTWYSGGSNHSDIVYTAAEQAAGNPFWNDAESKVDFASYVTAQGKSNLDYVYVLLGWNNVRTSMDTYKANVETFIGNILDAFPSCKIVLLGLEVPSMDGLAHNYGSTDVKDEYYYQMAHVWKLNDLYKQIASENSSNVSFVNIAGQFDTEHNMPQSTRAVNNRNSETETYQTNGVHPAQSGYYQIADACWRDFHHKLQA